MQTLLEGSLAGNEPLPRAVIFPSSISDGLVEKMVLMYLLLTLASEYLLIYI